MKYRTLANTGENLSIIGLGCMGMSQSYGATDERQNLETLHHALDLGINFWDTADIYGNGHNEELLSKVLSTNREKIFIASKFGFRSLGDGSWQNNSFDGSPKWIKEAIEQSLKRLKVDHIDLYYAHRVDPNIPIEETVGAMAELVKEGKVKYLGLSEASSASIRKAHAVHPISALQSEYSLLSRNVEKDILETTRALGITLVPFSPLARGLFDQIDHVSTLADDDFRKTLPRFQKENLANNQQLAQALNDLALSKNATGTQLALAWLLAQGEDIIPIPGTKRIKYLDQNVEATKITLSEEDLRTINEILIKYPHTGERYTEGAMKLVNN